MSLYVVLYVLEEEECVCQPYQRREKTREGKEKPDEERADGGEEKEKERGLCQC